ncbi:MAG: DUF6804 family protein [Candidatus Beckwithbacteria bacterium]
MNIKSLSIISGILLLLAIPSIWPYGFYILLRWFICISAIIVTIGFKESNLNGWALSFVGVAFLFNPIIPIYLSKASWVGIDLISAILFFLTLMFKKKG